MPLLGGEPACSSAQWGGEAMAAQSCCWAPNCLWLWCCGHAHLACWPRPPMQRSTPSQLAPVAAAAPLRLPSSLLSRCRCPKFKPPWVFVRADKQQRLFGKGGKARVSARKGEADRHIPDFKPKHLFAGKRPRGTADRR